MTLGELARLFNDERKIGAKLTVVPAANWRRDDWFDETGLAWVNPSPNMRNLNQATLYPGIGAIEYSNVSVGRGTDQPFEQIGAPWIDGRALAAALNARGLPGIRFYPVAFTPASSKYAKEACQGVFMVITNRAALQPVRVGLEIAAALWKLYGDSYRMENTDRLFGSREALERVKAGEDPAASRPAGPAPKRAGAGCARSTCSTQGSREAVSRAGPGRQSRLGGMTRRPALSAYMRSSTSRTYASG